MDYKWTITNLIQFRSLRIPGKIESEGVFLPKTDSMFFSFPTDSLTGEPNRITSLKEVGQHLQVSVLSDRTQFTGTKRL